MWMYSNTHWKHVQAITSINSRVLQALHLPRSLCTALDCSLTYTATFEPPPLESSSPQVSLAQWWVILCVTFISLLKQSSLGLSSPWNSCLSDYIFCCRSRQCQTSPSFHLDWFLPKVAFLPQTYAHPSATFTQRVILSLHKSWKPCTKGE